MHRSVASDDQTDAGVRLKVFNPPCPPLPYIPPPFPGEMLSSWLRRTAAEYGIELRHLTAHWALSVSRTCEIDCGLPTDDVQRVAAALRSDPAEIRQMVHPPRIRALHPTSAPIQVCSPCRTGHRAATPIPVRIRAWFEYWEIECAHCRTPFSPPGGAKLTRCNPAREEPVWFESLRPAARVGARLLANFAMRPITAGFSPVTILRLLSMRFDAIRFANTATAAHSAAELFATRRLAEVFVPGLSERWQDDLLPEPWTADKPTRLVTARMILLAGMTNLLDDRDSGLKLLESAAEYVRHPEFHPLLLSLSTGTGSS